MRGTFPLVMKLLLPICSIFIFSALFVFGNSEEKVSHESPRFEFLDYLNIGAMRTSELGQVLLDHLEQNLRTSPDTAKLTKKIVQIYGEGFLNPVREFITAKAVSSDGKYELGFACITSNPKFPVPAFPKAEYVMIGGEKFSKLPQELFHLFPEHFLAKSLSVFARNTDNALILIACKEEEKAMLSQKFSGLRADTEKYKKNPGALIYRIFPRREIQKLHENALCPTIPAGEFQLSENDGKVYLSALFHCLNPEEQIHMNLFLTRFKHAIITAAEETPSVTTKNALTAVADALKISASGNDLKLEIRCSTKDFPDFFEWRNKRTGL